MDDSLSGLVYSIRFSCRLDLTHFFAICDATVAERLRHLRAYWQTLL
jgi:hypothetical protein